MAKKAAAPGKKTVARKAAAPAKPAKKNEVSKGESLACNVCGLSVVVEEVGGILVSQESALLCCGKPMMQLARKAKAAKK